MKSHQNPIEYAYKEECLQQFQTLQLQGYLELFYADESGFSLNPVIPYSWQYPNEQVRIFPKRTQQINVFGIMNQDNRLFSFKNQGSINTEFIIESIEKWATNITKTTVLVLDNAAIHHAKNMKDKIEQWQNQHLFVFFLPTYSPHLNKIETLWRKVKYEWLNPLDYQSLKTLNQKLDTIFKEFGENYKIEFK